MVKHKLLGHRLCWDACTNWDALGSPYTYQIILWFLQQHNINNNKVIHYDIMHIYKANYVIVKNFSAGTPNGFCRDKCVLHVLLPGQLVIAGILYSK